MWINAADARSGSAVRPCRVWILLAVTHLTFDVSLSSAPGTEQLRLTPPPAPRPRPRDLSSLLHWRAVTFKAHPERRRRDPGELLRLLLRPRRQVGGDSSPQDGRTTTVSGFIDWGPTGTDEGPAGDDRNVTHSTSSGQSTPTLPPPTTSPTSPRHPHRTVSKGPQEPQLHTTTRAPAGGDTPKPDKPYGETPGLAVHQIITITVSLIMVIAALITTLVLKNCCAQSASSRHNSHQRKIHQQEESCQNLTDFTPARVPGKVDIFSAYDSLQCSHECLRGGVPIYTDEMIQQTPVYKSAYNGNRPSPTERQLIPVAFVSEKWFEISC